MSGGENVSNHQFPGAAFNKGHQGGGGADFFNSFPSQPAPYQQQQQQQATPGLPPTSMNPAFQPQGPPVFYNPMDYQKPVENSLPVMNHHQGNPWQDGHQHPSNGMGGYENQNWNQSAAGYTNHDPNQDTNHGESQYGGVNHDAGVQGWQGQAEHHPQGMNPQYPETWNYNNPHMDNGTGYQQQPPYDIAQQAAHGIHGGYPGDQPTHNPQGVQNLEADNESVSSGGGFAGFFNDREEDDVDLVHHRGKETASDSSASVGLSGPDIIPAPTQELTAEQRNSELDPGGILQGPTGGVAEPHVGVLPDLGQRPNSHGDISQPQLGFDPTNSDHIRTDMNPLLTGSQQSQGLGVLEPYPEGNVPLVPNPTLPTSSHDSPPSPEVRFAASQENVDTSGMPEIVKQSSPVKPELLSSDGQNLPVRTRSQSSDLISDIQDAAKGPMLEGGPLSEEPAVPSLSPQSSLPSVGSVDPGETAPRVDQSLPPMEEGNREGPPAAAPSGGVIENHPDLSASVPLSGQVWKPDLTNIDHTPSSPTGPHSLTAATPTTSDLDTSHTSAFRSISGRHTPKPTPAVDPSPPLWSTGVPPVTGNILLAPALSQPSIMPVLHPSPVKLQPRTTPSTVSHPSGPVPLRATAEALGPAGLASMASGTNVASGTDVNRITDRLGTMQVGTNNPSGHQNTSSTGESQQMNNHPPVNQPPAVDLPTSQPTFEFGRGYQPPASTATAPTTSQPGNASEAPATSQAPASLPQVGPGQSTGIPGSDSVQSIPRGQEVPQGNPPQGQGVPGAPQHPQSQQYPPYGGHGAYDPRYGGYPGGYDRYGRPMYGQRYDATGRPPDPYQQQQHQYGRRSPYKQGPAWLDYGRQQSGERPPSRQAWGQGGDHAEGYNYQRYYKDREEHARREEYYRQWYQQRGGWPQKWWRAEEYRWYYQRARQAQQARNYKEGDQSGGSDYRDQSGAADSGNRTNESNFASEFHHAGGGTPEQYGSNQSRIQEYSRSGYGSHPGEGSYLQDGSYSQGYDSYQQELSSYPEQTQTVTPPPPERTTPSKFGIAHVVARFSPGGHLIKVLPNTPADGMPATVEIHRVEDMLEESEEAVELKAFPGPLVRGETHKSDVIGFATRKAKEAATSTALSDRESVSLLWELMQLLCRQNGSVLETDISEMLLQTHSSTTGGEEEGEASSQDASTLPTRNIQKDTEEFRRLLLYGRKKESLEFAMKANLWGHALLLAGKMDARTHASVMTRFANSLEMNDPLQTLYQLMSDRQPAAVTSCADEKWGDWRPHLAMILSNLQTTDSEIGIKSITALGDSLATRGLLHASHFCYLMAQVGLGPYTHKATKIVLLGSSHRLPFTDFATNMAIQLTEVYEYAQLLGNKHYLLPNFQAYKFLYATRLAGHGMLEQALHYCEVIATSIQFKPEHYSRTLVEQVCELANRLKYHDTQYYDGRHLTEPQWLMELQGILNQMKDGTIQPPSKSETPVPWVESCSNFSTMEGGSSDGRPPSTDDQPQYTTSEYQDQYNQEQQWGQQQQWGHQQQWGQQQYTEHGGHIGSEGAEPTPTSDGGHGFSYNQEDVHQHQNAYTDQQWQYGQQNQQYQGEPDLAASGNSNFTEYSTTTGTAGDTTDYGESMNSQKGFDYYDQSIPRNRADTADTVTGTTHHRQRTKSGSSHQSRSRTVSASSNRSEGKPKESAESKARVAPKAPAGGGGGWFSGFFNKIRARNGKEIHLPDDSTQDIVWDETKKKWVNTLAGDEDDTGPQGPPPSDHELNKQQQSGATSTDGPPAPPPGMNKFSRNLSVGKYVDVLAKDSSAPTVPAPSSLLPPMQSVPTAPVNFYIPDSAPDGDEQPQQIGNPDSEPQTPTPNQTQAAPPQFFNPGSFGAGTTQAPSSQQFLAPPQPPPSSSHQENLSHSSSMSSLSEEVSHLTNQSVKEAAQPVAAAAAPPPAPGAPLMFNPTQMAQPASFPIPGAGKPSRYGARRQYPAPR